MDNHADSEIVLYDLACTKNVCFSPVVWRIRMMLNYKQVPYRTIFLEFQEIELTLKALGVEPPATAKGRYTVPTIYHVPTDQYMMDSIPISQFIESTYLTPAVPLTSKLGREIEEKARSVGGTTFRRSVMPREIRILSPAAADFFRRSREAALGHPLEDLLDNDKEEQSWKDIDGAMRAVSDLMQTNKADGPFILGARPSYTDFFIAGSLHSASVIDEGVFERNVKYEGFKQIYQACLPYMEKRD